MADVSATVEPLQGQLTKLLERTIIGMFNYIELFYNPTRRHGNNGDLSPMEFENNYFRNQAGV
jgi:putative transposase